MPDPFDPFRLELAPADIPTGRSRRPPRPKPGEKFLRGPIPWPWVEAAAALEGKALAVGLGIWFEAGCRSGRTVPVTLARLARLGMSADSARRGLRALERVGLVTVERPAGRALVVTLRDFPETAAS